MTKDERAAEKCLKEVKAILDKHGFAFLPVPLMQQTREGAWVTVVDLRLQKVPKKGA
jgi:hypothetical protein